MFALRMIATLLIGVMLMQHTLAKAATEMARQTPRADPPFSGTIFLDPDIITADDATTFQSALYAGQGMRTMYDRRVSDWITVNAFLFNASFSDGLQAEIQVNPEFGTSEAAEVEAQKYGRVIGQLPRALRADVQTVWIHQGVQPFGGGNNNLLIHIGQSALYEADGILEETLVHEAAHTSLDATHAAAPGWLAAQQADSNFISTYARDNPTREDIAESFLPYLALRYRADRISQELTDTFTQTIPNRITYFDSQNFAMEPIRPRAVLTAVDDLLTTTVNTPVMIDALGNDAPGVSTPVTITAHSQPISGTTALLDTHFVYTPSLDFIGTDSFTYTIRSNTEEATATVTIQVVSELIKLYLPLCQR